MRFAVFGVLCFFYSIVLGDANGLRNDSLALVGIDNANPNQSYWNYEDPVSCWNGVTVSSGRVTELCLEVQILPDEIGNLVKLKKLKVLGLTDTSNISAEIMNLKELIELDVKGTKLTKFPPEFLTITNLKELDISRTNITHIPREIANLENINVLNVERNALKELPAEIGSLKCLKTLNCSHNEITSLPKEICNLVLLETLLLRSNQILEVPREIKTLINLKYVDLAINELKSIPSEVKHLSNLLHLNLANNNIFHLPVEIGYLINLQDLHCEYNNLNKLPYEIENLIALKKLFINNNDIGVIPSQIGNLTKLIALDISDNFVGEIPLEIGNLPNLRWMNFNDNKLSTLPLEIMKTSPSVDSSLVGGSHGHEGGHMEYYYSLDLKENNIDESSLDSQLIVWLDKYDPDWRGAIIPIIEEKREVGISNLKVFQNGNLLHFSNKLSNRAILNIYSPNGRVIKSVPIHNNECCIQGLATGFFALQIIDKNVSYTAGMMIK